MTRRNKDERIEGLEARLSTIAKIMHYPRCWDTAAYPTLESAIGEAFECSAHLEANDAPPPGPKEAP